MRIPFLRPKSDEAAPAKAKRSRPAKAVPQVDDVMDVQTARTQARRRLVGALVLLLIGVVGFPILFETTPRPLPMDTPMEAVRREAAAGGLVVKESAPPLTLPSAVPAAARSEPAPTASVAATPAVAAAPTAPSAPSAPIAKVAAPAARASAPVAKASAPAAKASAPTTKASAPALKPATPAPAASAPAASKAADSAPAAKPAAEPAPVDGAAPRYVVQAGAYKESGKLREARSKIEGLGYKTYTQVIESDSGSRTRVRVGPYPTQEEAEAVAAKIKKNGLPAAIVKL